MKFCDQVLNYKIEIEGLQRRLEMPTLPIIPYLVCPDFAPEHIAYCHERGVTPIQFSPFELLQKYYLAVRYLTYKKTYTSISYYYKNGMNHDLY